MAGYLFTFSSEDDMKRCIHERSYSTLMSPRWSTAAASTLGDYVTMRPGDSVYFFSKRKVYGIGKIVEVGDGRCVTENFPGATSRRAVCWDKVSDKAIRKAAGADGKICRWIIAFDPDPCFFEKGIDMDDLLSSNPPAFRSLRVFWNRSFIKLDDEENAAFKTTLLRANLVELNDRREEVIGSCDREALSRGNEPDIQALLASSRNADGSLRDEMLLEVGLLHQLRIENQATSRMFGKWNYLSHQVNASPFKPIQYMDRIDVFGYRYIEDYEPIIEKYLVIELKKDSSGPGDIPQVMKYVDWVCKEYAHNDYSLIQAFLVAHSFEKDSLSANGMRRDYTAGYRPAEARTWQQLALVTYNVNPRGLIEFSRLEKTGS